MRYRRTPIELESPEQLGYDRIRNNLSESSYSDMHLRDYGVDADVGDLLLPYGDHLGLPRLRKLIAAEGPGLRSDDVLVTAGAAAALFTVSSALLDRGAHALVCAPNYATNLETPFAVEADLERLELHFENGWRLDLDEVASRLRPDTRLVSVTYPQNPTGSMISRAELQALVELVDAHPVARLLVDETYRELAYGDPLPLVSSLSARAIGVSSMSKTYGLPGLRIGWLTCRDTDLMDTLLAAKEQIFITGGALDEELTARVLERRGSILPTIQEQIATRLALVREWIEEHEIFEWVEPKAGAVCFPRIRPEILVDVDLFYRVLFEEHGTYVGAGHWFDQDRRFFRLGFAWPQVDELTRGLASLDAAVTSAVHLTQRTSA